MCGITGIIDPAATTDMLWQSVAALAHRGPDGQGIYTDSPLQLGHTRLAVQDLSERAAQPMLSDDGRYVLVYNGEWYDHMDTRRELEQQGLRFRSGSDTETLLQGYIRYGAAILQRMNGIFAFALYDKAERKLFLARDHFGVKPLYYYIHGSRFLFASELKAMLPLGIDRELNPDAFYQTLLLQWHLAADTGFRHVQRLLPGHSITIYTDRPSDYLLDKWYRPAIPANPAARTEQDWKTELEQLLESALHRQLLSDRQVGFFLSGGLDSSLLAAMAKPCYDKSKQVCFTIDTGNDFRKEGFGDDLPYARKVAAALQADLQVIPVSADIIAGFDRMIWQLDEAQGDLAPLLSGQIAAAARDMGVQVLIGGVGADDIFSGYRRHQAMAYEGLISRVPTAFRKGLKYSLQHLPGHPATRRLKKMTLLLDMRPEDRIRNYYFWTDPLMAYYLFSASGREMVHQERISNYFKCLDQELPADADPLNRMLHYELNSFLPNHNLNYTDKTAMAHGVEVRVPYLDKTLVAWSRDLPAGLKMKGTTTKYLLRKVAASYLPADVIYRKKTGFGAPVRQWLQADTSFRRSASERLHEGALQRSGLFDQEAISRLWKDTVEERYDGTYTILSLMAVESWLRQFAASPYPEK